MGSLVQMGLSNALVAGGLALVAILAGRFARRPAMVHALWLLVLLKLITPPVVALPVPWWEESAPAAAAPEEEDEPDEVAVVPPPQLLTEIPVAAPPRPMRIEEFIPDANGKLPAMPVVPKAPEVVRVVAPPAAAPAPRVRRKAAAAPAPAPSPWPGVLNLLGIAWVAGAAGWFAVAAYRVVRFQRLLRLARPAPAELQDHADQLARQMGLRQAPRVALVPGPVPPLLWALGSPRLYFPQALLPRIDEAGRSALLVHELAHVARRDHWVRWLEMLACGLYWWYPLTWFACLRLHAAEEECCDAWVVSELPGYGAAYAGALLETVDFLSHRPAPLPPVASGCGRAHQLKRRMTMIVHAATPRGLSWAGRGLLLALLVVLPLTGGPGRSAAPPARETPVPVVEKEKPAPAERRAEVKQAAAEVPDLPDEPTRFAPRPRVLPRFGGGAFWACALSPDGKTVAAVAGGLAGSAEGEGSLTLFDPATGKQRACVVSPKPIRCVAYSPDGKTLATGDFDNRIHLRDPATGAIRLTLEGHTGAVNGLAFAPDGKTLYSASLDHTARAWDLATNKPTRTYAGPKDWVLSVAVSRDNRRIVTSHKDNTAIVWDAASGKQLHVLKGHTHWVEHALFSPDDSTIVTASQDGTPRAWDARTGKHLRDFAGHAGAVNALAFLAGGKKLASASHDQNVILWNVATGAVEARIATGHTERIYGLDVSRDGKTLVTASWDQTVKAWDVAERTARQTMRPRRYLAEHNYPLFAVAASPDGKLLAVCGEEKAVKLLDPATGRLVHLLEGHEDVVSRVTFSPDGATLASASFDGTVALWDVATGKRLRVLEGHEGWVLGVAFSPDGALVATGGYDRSVRLWLTRTGKEVAKFLRHKGGVRAIAFSRDGKRLASGGTDRVIRVWDVLQKEVAQSLTGHDGPVRALAFSADGRRVVSGSEDTTVRLWNVADGKQVASHKLRDMVRDVAFSPRGQRLACVDQSRMLSLLDPSNLTPVAGINDGTDESTGVAFGPGARVLYTVSLDRQVREYKAATESVRPLVTHGAPGRAMGFALYSPDGKSVASGGGTAVEVRPATFGRGLGQLEGVAEAAYGAAVSPDGTRLAVGTGDKLVRVYDMATRRLVMTLTGHEFRVWAVVWSPDGQSLATVAGSWEKPEEIGEVTVWDAKTGKARRSLAGLSASTQTVAWSPDGKLLAVGSRDGFGRIYDAASGKPLHALAGHKGSVRSVVFSPDNATLATGDDEAVRLWAVADGKETAKLAAATGVNCLDWSRDGRTIVAVGRPTAANGPGEIRLWRKDKAAFEAKPTLKGHQDSVLCCALSPDGKRLLTGGGTYSTRGEVALWEVESGALLCRTQSAKLWVEAVAFTKDGKTAITAGGSAGRPGEVMFWDVDCVGGWRADEGHKGYVACGAYSRDGRRLATGGHGGGIKVWDAATGKLEATLSGHKGAVRQVQFSPDGKTLASVGNDRTVRLWNLAASEESAELGKLGIQATGVSYSPDGKLLAACGGREDGTAGEVRVFDIATGKERTGDWAGKGAWSVAFTPDGKHLATGGVGAKGLRLYDVQTGKLAREVEGTASVRHLAFSADGKQLAAAGPTPGTVQVWDAVAWQLKGTMDDHADAITGVGFSPDGKHLVTASNDGTVKRWGLTRMGVR